MTKRDKKEKFSFPLPPTWGETVYFRALAKKTFARRADKKDAFYFLLSMKSCEVCISASAIFSTSSFLFSDSIDDHLIN